MYAKALLCILLLTITALPAYAQDSTMTPFTPAFRLGVGYTPKLYVEAGLALHKFRARKPGSVAHKIYLASEFTTTYYGDRGFLLTVPKLGYTVSSHFLAMGIEGQFLSDGRNKSVAIAPQAGFSLLGMLDLLYGYRQFIGANPFPAIGAHRLSLTIALYRKPFVRAN